jgi:ectoine hydroxylase-related dioxygenase (phytanoyl-CoA dioxygenase family)
VDSLVLKGWSEKEGCTFVQPPVSMLRQMAAVRVHIDPCPVESGALRVVPGSHLLGVLSPAEAQRIHKVTGEHAVSVRRGGALLMKPLLLHASPKAATPVQRRVLHFVFGPRLPPFGLTWQYAI